MIRSLCTAPSLIAVSYHHVSNEEHKIETVKIISFSKLAIFTVALPLCGFMFCIIWSLAYNFVESTSTHCGVQNYLPSVSASIGSFSPQKFVWRFTIAVHSAPRYLVSFIYYFLIHGSKSLLWLNLVEISALLGLTVVSSTEIFCKYNFIIKKLFFCVVPLWWRMMLGRGGGFDRQTEKKKSVSLLIISTSAIVVPIDR